MKYTYIECIESVGSHLHVNPIIYRFLTHLLLLFNCFPDVIFPYFLIFTL